jgi:hypothetical protein|eukprot:COSAG02_NODE_1075_length_14754_cov_18.686796_2_plen_88_part_00
MSLRRCPAGLQELQLTAAAAPVANPGNTSTATDTLSNSLGSMAVSPETSCSSCCAQLLADSTDTLMTEYEALDPALLGANAPQRLVR